MKSTLSSALAVIGIAALGLAANAAPTTYDLAWSGASLGNTAVATGTITMDPSVLIPVGDNDNSGFFFPANPFVSALQITVSGASSGNGTFNLSDFDTVLFEANGALNYNTQLVGQPTFGNAWGTPDGGSGDFNLFNRTGVGGDAPDGSFNFTLRTDAGTEDNMLLTSFTPAATGTPEPGSLALISGLSVTGLALLKRKRAAVSHVA